MEEESDRADRARCFPPSTPGITLTQTAQHLTSLAVTGTYRRPLGRLGAGLDRAIMRRVAQATIQAFTCQIGTAITYPVSSQQSA